MSCAVHLSDVFEMRDRYALLGQLRDARDLIVQLQRELERAREVIEQQRKHVQRRKVIAPC